MPTVSTHQLSDEEIIKSFRGYEGPVEPGFVIDFLGVKTRSSYICGLPQEGAVVGYPIPAGIQGNAIEYAGVLRAVLEAEQQVVAVELGAGWAPWLVTAARAAALRGIDQVNLVGVEGCKEHCEFMVTHFLDNGLEPEHHRLIHGVAGILDGMAHFPVLADPAANYGARALADQSPAGTDNANGSLLRRLTRKSWRMARQGIKTAITGSNGTVQVRRYSLPTLLGPFAKVDLVHVDIQGDEYDVLASARRVLKEKVKRLVIGTHGRDIEQKLLDELASQSMVLESDEACHFMQHHDRMVLQHDGCQVWRNPALS